MLVGSRVWANGAGHEKWLFGGGTGAGDPGAPAVEAQGRSVMGRQLRSSLCLRGRQAGNDEGCEEDGVLA